MRTFTAAIAFVCLVGIAFAGVEDVMILGKDNFTETISGDATVLVKFYAPWCGHCKSMKEDYEKAAEELKGLAILAEVDATVEEGLAEEYKVQGFPTLKLFQGGQMIMDYSGPRNTEKLVSFVKNSLLPPVKVMTEEDIKSAAEKDAALFLFVLPEGVTDPSTSDVADKFKHFETAARKVRPDLPDQVEFGSADATLAKILSEKATATPGQMIMKTKGTGDECSWKAVDVTEKVSEACLLAAVPIFGELSRETAQLYVSRPCVILFAEPGNKKHDDYKKTMAEAAKKLANNGKAIFTWIDAKALAKFQEQVGVTKDPSLVIIEFEGLVKYIWDIEIEFTADNIAAWVKKYIDGELKPDLKSADIPADNSAPVKIVVGSTWEEIVTDKDKDVLIEQYAPWCGHCKKLEPIYTSVAERLSGVASVVIAKMDATENDAPAPYSASGYPTLHFFPAGKEGVEYKGDRTEMAMIKFIHENASKKFDMPEGIPAAAQVEEEDDEEDYEDEAEDDDEEKEDL